MHGGQASGVRFLQLTLPFAWLYHAGKDLGWIRDEDGISPLI